MKAGRSRSQANRQRESLYEWFAATLSVAFGLPLHGPPREVLRQAEIPLGQYPWLRQVEDGVFPLRQEDRGVDGAANLMFPDLESRAYEHRRRRGQFFTPETAVRALLQRLAFHLVPGPFLDPACGAGAFLVPLQELLLHSATDRSQNRPGRGEESTSAEIYGVDIDPQALLVCLGRLLHGRPQPPWPQLLCRDFLRNPPPFGHFGAILGNPPYKVNLDLELRTFLTENFSTVEGELDLYTFFYEQSIRCLRDHGRLLLLTAHTFLVNKHCRKIREFLFARHRLLDLWQLPARFFAQAQTVQPVVVHLAKQDCIPGGNSNFWPAPKTGAALAEHRHLVEQQIFLCPTGLREATVSQSAQEVWQTMSDTGVALGKIAKVGVGIQESTHREQGRVSRFVTSAEAAPKTAVPVLRGREIGLFRCNWEGKYLDYGPHLTFAGNPEIFRGEKILYQNLRNETLPRRLVATLDRHGFFPKNSLSVISAPCAPFSLEYLLGIFNSCLLNGWFQARFFSFHITVGQVRQLPVPVADRQRRQRVEALVQEILDMNTTRTATAAATAAATEAATAVATEAATETVTATAIETVAEIATETATATATATAAAVKAVTVAETGDKLSSDVLPNLEQAVIDCFFTKKQQKQIGKQFFLDQMQPL